jgi:hypothetical protein
VDSSKKSNSTSKSDRGTKKWSHDDPAPASKLQTPAVLLSDVKNGGEFAGVLLSVRHPLCCMYCLFIAFT